MGMYEYLRGLGAGACMRLGGGAMFMVGGKMLLDKYVVVIYTTFHSGNLKLFIPAT